MTAASKPSTSGVSQGDDRLSSLKQMVRERLAEVKAKKATDERPKASKERVR